MQLINVILLKKKNDSSMITVNNSNIEVIPIHRVGEAINDYLPLDVLDGLGAKKFNDDKIRIFVNHEIVNNAKISYFDFKINDFKKFRDIKCIESNVAFDKIISKLQNPLTRFCSASLYNKGQFGLLDDIFFCGEEVSNGRAFALNIQKRELHHIEILGEHSYENIVMIDLGLKGYISCLIGDDNKFKKPLYLYIGKLYPNEKDDFLKRNGFKEGFKYHYCENGYFEKVDSDIKPLLYQRIEDIAVNPNRPNCAVFSETIGGIKNKGNVHYIEIQNFNNSKDFPKNIKAKIELFDPKSKMINPDNLLWTKENQIFIQEDNSCFNQNNIWLYDMNNKEKKKIIATLNNNCWESSGLIDISNIINDESYKYFVLTVQAHKQKVTVVKDNKKLILEDGQLILMRIKINL